MKKIIFVCIGILLAAQIAYAHPPSKIEISFDSQTKFVTALITHPVEDQAKHYIGKVDVALNGKEIISHKLSRQDNADTQTVSYRIPDANVGDEVSVEGYCNVAGKKEAEIKVQ